jgi:hypothetical protein
MLLGHAHKLAPSWIASVDLPMQQNSGDMATFWLARGLAALLATVPRLNCVTL